MSRVRAFVVVLAALSVIGTSAPSGLIKTSSGTPPASLFKSGSVLSAAFKSGTAVSALGAPGARATVSPDMRTLR